MDKAFTYSEHVIKEAIYKRKPDENNDRVAFSSASDKTQTSLINKSEDFFIFQLLTCSSGVKTGNYLDQLTLFSLLECLLQM